jgi:hypothetical protein
MVVATDEPSFIEPSGSEQRGGGTSGPYLRWTLALLSFGAAALHFAYAPTHFDEYWLYGLFFVTLAWAQLAWGLAVLLKPARVLLYAGLLNTLVLALYFLSRTVGVGFGPLASTSEAYGFPDILCAVLEGLIVVGCAALLYKPALARRPLAMGSFWPGFAVALAVSIIVASSASLSPSAGGGHSHAAGGAHAAADAAAGGHDHSATAAVATGDLTGSSSSHQHGATAATTGDSPCEKSGPPASEGQTQGEGHDHRGPSVQKPLTEDERVTLEQQQEVARTVAVRYPTLADAKKGGYFPSTTYVPCIGTHVTNTRYATKFDVANPSELLYDGTTPDSKIVGLSYLVWSPSGPPAGFAGDNDFWHTHSSNGGLCMKGTVIGSEAMSTAECERLGGKKIGLKGVYMVHDWVVPGWECSWGVFAGECPELGGKVGKNAWS